MNLEYIKRLDLNNSLDIKDFFDLVWGIHSGGMTSSIDDIIDLFFEDQTIQGSFKAYMLLICNFVSMLSRENEKTTKEVEHINSLIKSVSLIARKQKIKTFEFYSDLNFMESILNSIYLSEKMKFAIYAWSFFIENKLNNDGIAFVSIYKLLKTESDKLKLKTEVYIDALKSIGIK